MFFETITHFKKMLQNLNTQLQKGAAYADHKKFEASVLVQSRLAPLTRFYDTTAWTWAKWIILAP